MVVSGHFTTEILADSIWGRYTSKLFNYQKINQCYGEVSVRYVGGSVWKCDTQYKLMITTYIERERERERERREDQR